MLRPISLLLIFYFFFQGVESQEKKWNIELNYSLIPADGFGGKDNVIDFGFKYPFYRQTFFDIGGSTNFGIFGESLTLMDAQRVFFSPNNVTNFIVQPRIFSELHIPFLKKFKPSFGIGYSHVFTKGDIEGSFWGFNANVNFGYDISNQWILQLNYDYVSLSALDYFEGLNNLKLGVGFRF